MVIADKDKAIAFLSDVKAQEDMRNLILELAKKYEMLDRYDIDKFADQYIEFVKTKIVDELEKADSLIDPR